MKNVKRVTRINGLKKKPPIKESRTTCQTLQKMKKLPMQDVTSIHRREKKRIFPRAPFCMQVLLYSVPLKYKAQGIRKSPRCSSWLILYWISGLNCYVKSIFFFIKCLYIFHKQIPEVRKSE